MPEEQIAVISSIGIAPSVNKYRRFFKTLFGRKVVVFGTVVILILISAAIFAPLIAPYDPIKHSMTEALLKPSWEHLLGTDVLGRDTFSRVVYGTRVSLVIGLSAITLAGSIGMLLGLIAGYFGGATYMVVMRCVDTLMAIPMIPLAIVIAAMLGSGLKNVVLAIGISGISIYARMMCAQVLSIRESDYILAYRSMGANDLRIMFRHLLPNCLPPLIVVMTMQIGITILTEAGLSFLGIGIQPPTPAWGAMVTDGYRFLLYNPVLSIAPGVAIILVVFAFNMVGDGLRDTIDPRLRGTL